MSDMSVNLNNVNSFSNGDDSNVSDYNDEINKKEKVEKVNLDEDKNVKTDLTDDEILDQMRRRFAEASSAFRKQREAAKTDFEFIEGKQFTDREIQIRRAMGRPYNVYNKTQQYVNNAVNQLVADLPVVNVKRSDYAGNDDTMLAYQSIIKADEYRSDMAIQVERTATNQVSCGEGYIRVFNEYESPMSFDQRIRIEAIEDIFNVLIDPNFSATLDNMEYAFISNYISKEEFESTYPKSDMKNINRYAFTDEFEDNDQWITGDMIRVTEYFYFEYETDKVYLLEGNIVIRKKDYNKMDKEDRPEILREKTEVFKSIKWIKSNGYEILEKRDFVGDYIPVVPFFGMYHRRNGELHIKSLIRDLITAQKEHNYMKNTTLELIAMSPKVPFIGQEGIFEGHEEEWESANFINVPYLEYKPLNSAGQAAQPPQRSQFDTNIDSVLNAAASSENDFKSMTGIYDPSLGAKSSEISGVAIMNKQKQSELITSTFSTNMLNSMRLLGRIMIKMIPSVYSVDRKVKIYDQNNNRDNSDKYLDLSNVNIDFTNGNYDVEVVVGPYGETQRQEAFKSLAAIAGSQPDQFNNFADIMFDNADFKGAEELANRYRKLVNPIFNDEEESISPAAQQAIDALKMQMEQMQLQATNQMASMEQALNKLTQMNNENENRITSKLDEIASKERMNSENNLVKLLIEQQKHQAQPIGMGAEKARLTQAQDNVIPTTFSNKDETIVDHINDPITIANNAQAAQDQVDSLSAAQQVQGQDNDFSDDDLSNLLEGSESYLDNTRVNRRQ